MAKRQIKTARDIMHSPARCVQSDEPIVEAARTLAKKGWSGAPVLDADGAIVGLLSEADVVRGLAAAAFFENPPPTLVSDVMTREVESVSPEADLFRLVMLVGDGHKRVPVVEGGRPVGMITRRDVMKALVEVVEERYGDRSVGTYDAIAEAEGTHNPFSKG